MKQGETKRDKVWVVSVTGAVAAISACLIPPVLIVLVGASALAFVPAWLDLVLVPVFLLSVGVLLVRWYRQKRAGRQPGALSQTQEG